MSQAGQEPPQDLAAAYALGALSPEEARRFEAFLRGSPEAQREVAEYREVAALLALAGPDTAPSPDLRQRVLSRMHGPLVHSVPQGRISGPVRRPGPPWGALAAGLIAAVGLGFGYVQLRETQNLRGQLSRAMQRLAETSDLLTEREATLNAIFEPGVQLFQLTASGDPDPGIQLFWDRQRHRAILHGFKLRQVPQGRAYQLWFIKDGTPVPSVTFRPESTGHVRVEQVPVPPGGDVSAAAVTVEPESGSSQPTSPILLVGSLERS
ncbi:MAG: anti-sigma factor [Gemmatimonadales bacterium]